MLQSNQSNSSTSGVPQSSCLRTCNYTHWFSVLACSWLWPSPFPVADSFTSSRSQLLRKAFSDYPNKNSTLPSPTHTHHHFVVQHPTCVLYGNYLFYLTYSTKSRTKGRINVSLGGQERFCMILPSFHSTNIYWLLSECKYYARCWWTSDKQEKFSLTNEWIQKLIGSSVPSF